jgi:hypothetical protein
MALSSSDKLALAGIVPGVLLVVLDKAGKLRGPILYWLLALCALTFVPFAVNNSLIESFSDPWKWWSRCCGLALIALAFSALMIWITPRGGSQGAAERGVRNAKPPSQLPAIQLPTPSLPKAGHEQKPAAIVVPELSIATQEGLTISDFPDLTVSSEMLERLRKHTLVVVNPNQIELHNLVVRFQLPEPVYGNLVIEDRPAGVEITWNACRMVASVAGQGSATPLQGGGTRLTTAPGASISMGGNGDEECSPEMNNAQMQPTGLYQLKIERLPSVTTIRLGFLTSNASGAGFYMQAFEEHASEPPSSALNYFGEGTFQVLKGDNAQTRPIFIPLTFDPKRRSISSSPASGETGKWTMNLIHMT